MPELAPPSSSVASRLTFRVPSSVQVTVASGSVSSLEAAGAAGVDAAGVHGPLVVRMSLAPWSVAEPSRVTAVPSGLAGVGPTSGRDRRHVRQRERGLVGALAAVVVGHLQRQLDHAVVGAGDVGSSAAGAAEAAGRAGVHPAPATYFQYQVWVSLLPASVTEPLSWTAVPSVPL